MDPNRLCNQFTIVSKNISLRWSILISSIKQFINFCISIYVSTWFLVDFIHLSNHGTIWRLQNSCPAALTRPIISAMWAATPLLSAVTSVICRSTPEYSSSVECLTPQLDFVSLLICYPQCSSLFLNQVELLEGEDTCSSHHISHCFTSW